MRIRHVYLLLCAIGTILPYSQLIPWIRQHGLDVPLFARDLYANGVSGFFGWDVIVSALVLIVFIHTESRRLELRHRWAPVIAVLAVGVSLGLPLFLYQRQVRLDQGVA